MGTCDLLSGAGSSTLLDIVARRTKRGAVDGTVLLNGADLGDAYTRVTSYASLRPQACLRECFCAQRLALVSPPSSSIYVHPPGSYVDQDPAAIATQSVREILMTAARLRLPEVVTEEQKKQRVQALADEFGIGEILERRFGEVGTATSPVASLRLQQNGSLTMRGRMARRDLRACRRPRYLGWREATCSDRVPAGERSVCPVFG